MHERMITAEQLRALAQRASVDERTAARFMLGLRVRKLAQGRLLAAATELRIPRAMALGAAVRRTTKSATR